MFNKNVFMFPDSYEDGKRSKKFKWILLVLISEKTHPGDS